MPEPQNSPGELRYDVPGIHCAHCSESISTSVGAVPGVQTVEIDLDRKTVRVVGDQLSDTAIREALTASGYDVA